MSFKDLTLLRHQDATWQTATAAKEREGKGANATETMLIIRSYASFAQKGEKWCTLEKLPRISIPE